MNLRTKLWVFSSAVLLLISCSDNLKRISDTDSGKNTSQSRAFNKARGAEAKSGYGSSAKSYVKSLPGYLDQNWDHDTRLEWWYTSQGSRLLPYDWFLALERPGSDELVRSKKNMDRYRFISWPSDPKWNPDGLPIGFAVDKDPKTGKRYTGFTCAVCHTGKIAYNDQEYLVEGGPAHLDFDRFVTEISIAMKMTLADEEKFSRFANRLLGDDAQSSELDALKDALTSKSNQLNVRVKTNQPPYPYGHARLDAYGNIFNQVSVFAINEPSNAKPSNAPVSFPVLWDTPQHDMVQWNGSAVNVGIGPYTRNVGEAVGVFGDLRIEEVRLLGKKKLRYHLCGHPLVNNKNIKNIERSKCVLMYELYME